MPFRPTGSHRPRLTHQARGSRPTAPRLSLGRRTQGFESCDPSRDRRCRQRQAQSANAEVGGRGNAQYTTGIRCAPRSSQLAPGTSRGTDSQGEAGLTSGLDPAVRGVFPVSRFWWHSTADGHPTSHHEDDQDGKGCGVDPTFPIGIGISIHAPVSDPAQLQITTL